MRIRLPASVALSLLLALSIGFVACGGGGGDGKLEIEDIEVGDGAEVQAGDTITIHYTGTLEDGTVFDSSVERGEPATFPLEGLIQGWQDGIPGMKEGGTRRLIIPPDLAYGEDGSPSSIPANATLTFEIELISIGQPEEEATPIPSILDLPTDDGPPPTDAEETTTDSGLIIIDLSAGDGAEVPAVAIVNVYYTGWLEDGTVFDSAVESGEPISFSLDGVIAGWTEGIPGMKVGGTRRLIIPSELAYGEGGTGGIPPNSTLTFDIELLAIE